MCPKTPPPSLQSASTTSSTMHLQSASLKHLHHAPQNASKLHLQTAPPCLPHNPKQHPKPPPKPLPRTSTMCPTVPPMHLYKTAIKPPLPPHVITLLAVAFLVYALRHHHLSSLLAVLPPLCAFVFLNLIGL